jgi:hypothetical protein
MSTQKTPGSTRSQDLSVAIRGKEQEGSVMPDTFRIPPIYCPIEPAVHPEADLIEKRAIEWIDQFADVDQTQRNRLVQSRSAEFFARSTPTGVTDRVLAAAEWTYIAFLLDDHFDSGSPSDRLDAFLAIGPRIPNVLESPGSSTPEGPGLFALRDIGARFRVWGTPGQMRRFVDAHRTWLLGVAGEIEAFRRGGSPNLAESTSTRLCSDGAPVLTAMLELVNAIDLPEPESSAYSVRALTEITWLLLGWDNDLYSRLKETQGGAACQNLVEVLRHERHLTTEDALIEAVALRDRCMVLFLRLSDRTRRGASTELHAYLDALGQIIRANNDWGFHAPRYTTALGSGFGARRAEYSQKPSVSREDPVPVPAIAWWWRLIE